MSRLKFRVLLDSEKKQEVFRDIYISENDHFEQFYRAILNAFNFEGKEIGSFFISNDEWDKGQEISLMDMRFSDEDLDQPEVMSLSKIKDFIQVTDQKIILVYDFLRMWIFLIELIEQSDEPIAVPSVTLAIGTAPPEDSRMMQDEAFENDGLDEDEFDDFEEDYEDGYNEEDYSGYEEFDY